MNAWIDWFYNNLVTQCDKIVKEINPDCEFVVIDKEQFMKIALDEITDDEDEDELK